LEKKTCLLELDVSMFPGFSFPSVVLLSAVMKV